VYQDVSKSRHLVGVDANLVYEGTDENGEPADVGTVTVAVTDAYGTAVTAGAVAESGDSNEVRTATVAAANNRSVDRLTAVWSNGDGVLATTLHDMVGGFYCTVAEMRADTVLSSVVKHPTVSLLSDRLEVESMLDDACRRSFVPRFYTEVLSGTGTGVLQLLQADLREVAWAQYWTGTAWADLSVTVAEIPADPFGRAVLRDDVWPCGDSNIRVGYRFGWDRPPADLRRAVVKAVQSRRTGDNSGIPSRAISVQGTELGNVVLATPGLGKWITAVPEIDEVINRYRRRNLGVGR
jgi:hypothetical protein